MIDSLRWLLVVEVIGLAALPLAFWIFRSLPDRGYALGKILALILLTWVVWLVGNVLPVAGGFVLPVIVLLGGAAATWTFSHSTVIHQMRAIGPVLVIEEALFLAAFLLWTLLRIFVFHPGISHTEQYMDLTLLQGSFHAASYPPNDLWMSGHAVNYYYFGYLMYAMLLKLSGVAPAIGYNLALSTVFAFVVVAAYGVAYALCRRRLWAALAPLFVALLGNWHTVAVLIPSGVGPGTFTWFWDPTRVVGGNDTINEFPYFSLILGDLHPHLMALPITILAIGVALSFLRTESPLRIGREWRGAAHVILAGVLIGSLYPTNSWDFPAYTLLAALALVFNAYLTDASATWWHLPLRTVPVLGIAAVVAYLPFYLQYHSPAQGIGLVTTPTAIGQFLQVFGLFLLAVAILLTTLGMILQPAEAESEVETAANNERSALEAGSAGTLDNAMLAAAAAALILVVGLRFGQWTLALLVTLAVAGGALLWRVINTDEPDSSDSAALILFVVACGILASTEVFYLRDGFDGGPNYRMNTVFKFYYQGWTLLGIAGAYAVYRSWHLLVRHFSRRWAIPPLILVALGIGAAGIYSVTAPQSAGWGGTATSLNGEDILRAAHPTDAAAIDWLRARVSGTPVVLEAGNGGDYDSAYGRVAAFGGFPTVMGWAGHEYQWRGNDPEIARRVRDVTAIYATATPSETRRLLRRYHVRYVFVGDAERAIPGAQVQKFARFMRLIHSDGVTRVYTW